METLGVLILAAAGWFMYSGVVGLRPIKTARAIVQDPSNAANIIDGAVSYAKANGPADPGDDPVGTGAGQTSSIGSAPQTPDATSNTGAGARVQTPTTPINSPASAQNYAETQLASYGWGSDQMPYLVKLWNQESGWRWNAENASSGAYGIPQALPGDKMASVGADWKTNGATQITWGLQYIKQRYGSPQAAWAHEVANNWY